ncbi:MAG: DUF1499 domain-containing protein [Proteobacteria bacterium]|nr:DUF1499 domain-containing protein [Pseudomonadota bacterium]
MAGRLKSALIGRVLAVLCLLVGLLFAALALHLATGPEYTVFSGKRPNNLGVVEGQLRPCHRSPNCVSSQALPTDETHAIAPIAFAGSQIEAMAAARAALAGLSGARVIREEGAYLYAEVRSRLLGFVDDVELVFDAPAGQFHVRSASRLGRRDFGVNRARVEKLRQLIAGVPRA